jgi:large subunit ribosomal protein L30
MNRIAVIRVRGKVNVSKDVEATLKMLGLNAQNHCVLISDSPVYAGMLQKVKDYVTWGKVSKEDVQLLLKARGELIGNAVLTEAYLKKNTKFSSIEEFAEAFVNFKAELDDIPNLKKVFRLHPPRKGYKSIKKPFNLGGALGNRGEEIGKLLYRMR